MAVYRACYVLNAANFTTENSLTLVDSDVLPLKINLPVAQLFMSQHKVFSTWRDD